MNVSNFYAIIEAGAFVAQHSNAAFCGVTIRLRYLTATAHFANDVKSCDRSGDFISFLLSARFIKLAVAIKYAVRSPPKHPV